MRLSQNPVRHYLSILLVPLLTAAVVHAFTNPIRQINGSDPHMTYHNGQYYLTATSWNDVQLTAASTIEGLKTATPVAIYSDRSNPRRARNWWAPELHFVQDRWYIYFTTSIDDPDWAVMLPTLTQWVLGGPSGANANPLVGETNAQWEFLGMIRPENYQGGMLDGTIYNINGQDYFIFSSVNGTASPNGASLWISKLLSPTTVSPATLIAYPQYPWENNSSAVLEGPQGIRSPVTGDTYLVYSANDCNTPDYKLGTLRLVAEDADPLLPESWEKLPEPLLVTDVGRGIFGPGHNGFFKSPDGTQDWIAYHANRNASGRCNAYRQTFVQQVLWDTEDGSPRLSPPVPPGEEIEEPSGTGGGNGGGGGCRARRRGLW
ncbi:glycosyl hydrolase [Microdochium trichocladiopsis]|uniref:Glycosyl hydrolase n=1 Tax=Microdochium trichocladiopsis TaxID=1682393 RepID=A0A9P8Y3L1_9PEZI|nr:glycosyl hydrolase [Microdochium trichocladiopsis]KAH7028967.1 glycosyl hydrolase [Microdochium trichocladiopsis]